MRNLFIPIIPIIPIIQAALAITPSGCIFDTSGVQPIQLDLELPRPDQTHHDLDQGAVIDLDQKASDLNWGNTILSDPGHLRIWANAASAVGIYSNGYQPVAYADGKVSFDDPACPTTSDDGMTVSITGGCQDTAQTQWTGTASVVRSGVGDRMLTMDSFGSYKNYDLRALATGTVDIRQISALLHTFDVDLVVQEEGMITTIQYSGNVEGTYGTTTTWSGSGELTRDGTVAPTGPVQATTVDEVIDDAICTGQALSGKTTIVHGDITAIITYDGATDCDPDQAARWSLDGEDQGLIKGITCAAGDIASVPAPCLPAGILLLGAVGIALALRRRGKRHRPRSSP